MIDTQSGGGGGHAQRPTGYWSREVKRLRGVADPGIDQVVETYHRERLELADARDLVRSMIRKLSQAKHEPQRFTRDAIDQNGTWLTDALHVALADLVQEFWPPDLTDLKGVSNWLNYKERMHFITAYFMIYQ